MVYILAKFYLLGLSVIEKVCGISLLLGYWWFFLQGCPLSFYTFWAWACLPVWFSVSSSFLALGFVCSPNCGFSKKFVTEGFSRYLVYHNYDLCTRFFCSSTTDRAFSGYFFQFEGMPFKASCLSRQGVKIIFDKGWSFLALTLRVKRGDKALWGSWAHS